MGLDANGNLIVFNAPGSVVQVNPQTGAQNTLYSGGLLTRLDGGTLDTSHGGTIYVSNLATGSTPSQILAIDPASGIQRIVSSGGNLSLLTGLTLFSAAVSTNVVVSSSVNPALFGQSVTFTATISAQGSGNGTPTGTVQFVTDGSAVGGPVSVSTQNGVTTASFTIDTLGIGVHTITALYSGDGKFLSSTGSLSGGEVVNKPVTTTTLSSSINPSLSGQSVTFTATVSVQNLGNGTLTGMVQFQIDGTNFGNPVPLNSSGGPATATISTTSLPVGNHVITAFYIGDSNYQASSSMLTQFVNAAGAAPSATPAASSGTPTDSQNSATGSADSNSASSPANPVSTPPGPPAGSQNNNVGSADSGSASSPANPVSTPPALPESTTTSLLISASALPYGQPLTLTATVNPGTVISVAETGSVTFFDQGTALATVPLTGGMASFTLSTLWPGGHALSAAYSGDTNYAASSSSGAVVTVGTLNERFVNQVYLTVLQRPADPQGLVAWTTALDQGLSRAAVALAIEQSPEALADQVKAIYQQFLHRTPGPSEVAPYVSYLSAGGTLEQVRTAVISSPEYFQTRGGGTDSAFLVALYQDALNRSPDPGGLAGFTQVLNQGASRSQVALSIFGSTEYLRDLVANSYEQILKRAADEAGLDSFVNALQAGTPEANINAAMLGSNEFLSHV
jgi:hypothetical protein